LCVIQTEEQECGRTTWSESTQPERGWLQTVDTQTVSRLQYTKRLSLVNWASFDVLFTRFLSYLQYYIFKQFGTYSRCYKSSLIAGNIREAIVFI